MSSDTILLDFAALFSSLLWARRNLNSVMHASPRKKMDEEEKPEQHLTGIAAILARRKFLRPNAGVVDGSSSSSESEWSD